jgi:hypothetical protein
MTSYLLNQDGGFFLFQDGGEYIISSPVVEDKLKVIVKDNAGVSKGEFETFNNLKFGKRLNNSGEASFDIPLNNSKLATLLSLRQNTIYIYNKFSFEDGAPAQLLVWAGEQAKTDGKLQSDLDNWLTITCYTWLEQLTQRITAFEKIYTDTDAGEIAWDLIDESQRGVKNTGWNSPAGTDASNHFLSPHNAFSENESFATASANDVTGFWEDFTFNIPAGSTINGVEIKIKAKAASDADILVGVSSTANATSGSETISLATSNTEYTIGGPTDLFGINLVASDFDDANALLFITTTSTVVVSIDHIQVKVYYTIDDSDYDFGITQGSIEATTNRDRTYNNDVIAEKIIDLANVNSGFDFEITDDKIFNVYSVQGDDLSDSVVLEYGRNVKSVRVIEDFTKPANKAIVIGSAYGQDDIQRVEIDDLTKQGIYKIREQIYTEMDQVDTSNFTDRGEALIGKYGLKLLSVEIDLVESSVVLTQFKVGNSVTLVIKNNYYNINETYAESLNGMLSIKIIMPKASLLF